MSSGHSARKLRPRANACASICMLLPAQTCELPLQYRGRELTGCVSYEHTSACWAQAGR